MGANGATRLLKVAENTLSVLAIELFTAAQAIEFRRPLKSSEYVEKLLSDFRKQVPFIDDDKVMYHEIEKSLRFMQQYSF